MIQCKLKQIEKDVPVKVICNKSGKEVGLESDDNWVDQNLIHSFTVNFGYGSDFDMDQWQFDLYEKELIDFIKTFKVRPSGFAEDCRFPDKVFDEWRLTGNYNWCAGWSTEEIEEENKKREAQKKRVQDLMKTFKTDKCK